MGIDFSEVTEVVGEAVSREQIQRMAHRYLWAGAMCKGRDVLEIACGSGQGLGYLSAVARSLVAGDITPSLVERAKAHYGNRVDIRLMDAISLPFPDNSLDVVILFEAIYYLPDATAFVRECQRVLRPGGKMLITTSNKEMYDFNPSPHSNQYYGVVELNALCREFGFDCTFSGYMAMEAVSLRQRMLRPIKAVAVKLKLIPKTMAGKRLLKRLVFGGLVTMPAEISADDIVYTPPVALRVDMRIDNFKVIYCEAELTG